MELEESEVLSESLISFLEKTELGTKGARYAHLDVRERIKKLDFPQSFYIKKKRDNCSECDLLYSRFLDVCSLFCF